MNQKFGDLFAKFLFVFFIWTVIAFIFNIGWQYVMARNIFGIKKNVKIDSRSKYAESDIRWEQFKIFIWILLGVLYTYFIIQPQQHF